MRSINYYYKVQSILRKGLASMTQVWIMVSVTMARRQMLSKVDLLHLMSQRLTLA